MTSQLQLTADPGTLRARDTKFYGLVAGAAKTK